MTTVRNRTARRLFLMRHAEATHFSPGGGDRERELTAAGLAAVARMGAALADAGIERVLCSPAVRTRQTAAGLRLSAPVTVVETLYNCPPSRIATALSRLPDDVQKVLVVAHFPGIPELIHDVADATFDVAELGHHFAPATLAELAFDDPWSLLHTARLVRVLRP